MDGIIFSLDNSICEFWASREEKKAYAINCSSSLSNIWKPPLEGWVKVDVDASHGESGSIAAFVARDHEGNFLFFSSKQVEAFSSYEAEVLALEWATEYANTCSWRHVQWEIDAANVVFEVQAN